jgi:hypothetical protein
MKHNFLNTTNYSVAWFKQTHDRNDLDMKPPFQRNPVWLERQKSFLIDSILNGFPIPEIYMQESISSDGSSKHIIVDGQQRIRAVLEFIEGGFCIDRRDTPSWADMYFEDLSTDDKKIIFAYSFVVRTLPDIDDTQIRAIFQRLNRNVLALNSQELRQATYWGPFIKLMNELSNKAIWQEINVFTQNDIRRMLDVEFISELTIAVLNGLQNKKDKLESFYQAYEKEFEDERAVNDLFNLVLSEIVKILPNISKTRWRKKTDFYSLFLFFAKHVNDLPLSKTQRELAEQKLITFGEELNLFVKSSPDKINDFTPEAKEYGSGIRASTDLGSRKRRENGLSTVLKEIFSDDSQQLTSASTPTAE